MAAAGTECQWEKSLSCRVRSQAATAAADNGSYKQNDEEPLKSVWLKLVVNITYNTTCLIRMHTEC